MIGGNELAKIAAVANVLRPDWPARSILKCLSIHTGTKLAGKTYRDVLHAMVEVAIDPETKYPARVIEAGPWWQITRPLHPATPTPNAPICPDHGETAHKCTRCQDECVPPPESFKAATRRFRTTTRPDPRPYIPKD